MKIFTYTSDPYEPRGIAGIFETEEQRQQIINQYREYLQQKKEHRDKDLRRYGSEHAARIKKNYEGFEEKCLQELIDSEMEIPLGVWREWT